MCAFFVVVVVFCFGSPRYFGNSIMTCSGFSFFEQLQCEDAADQQCMAAAPPEGGKSELALG